MYDRAAQHFWKFPELVDVVTASLATHDGYWIEDMPLEADVTQVDGKTLAALARTSQLMHLCAVPVLWTCQDGLQNLIRCLPEGSWIMVGPDRYGHKEFRIIRALLPEDWSRFDKYAIHVKQLTFRADIYAPSAELLLALRAARPGQLLLPQLRLLNWDKDLLLDGQVFSPHWDMFTGPRLETVNLWCHAEFSSAKVSETIHDILKYLQDIMAPIKHLRIMVFDLPVLRHAIWTAFRGFRLLTSLYLEVFDLLPYSFWQSLSELPCLSRISLMAIESSLFMHDTADNRISALLPFNALEELDLTLETHEEVAHILRTSHFPVLQRVYLSLQLLSMRDTLQALYDHGPHTTLRHLTVNSHTLSSIPQDAVDSACLGCLTCFHNLTELCLDSHTAPVFNTTSMANLASALPHLRRLDIKTGRGSHVPGSTVQLEALSELIARCPDLELVALPFDTSAAHVALPTHGRTNEAIHVLGVGGNVVVNPPEVARFLACLCPNLRELSVWAWAGDAAETWQEVEALLPVAVDAQKSNRETCA